MNNSIEHSNIKTLQALCATSSLHERLDIEFNDNSGLITKISKASLSRDQVDYYFSDECVLFAAFGDIHIHAREDVSKKNIYKEDFNSTCCAALNGGVLFVGDMPNNPIPPIDDDSYDAKLNLTDSSLIPILLYAGIGPETRPLSFPVPYKVYMGPSIGELFFKDNESLDFVLKHYKNQVVSFHCEDPEILENNKENSSHELRRPVEAELLATETALQLIKKYHLKGKLCHYSAGSGLKLISQAKKEGLHVDCEVTPQHLFYSIEKLKLKSKKEQIYFQMNPPIRYEEDRLSLIEGLKSGLIDILATDHAPHSQLEKEKGMSGLPGLDTFGPFVSWLILNQKISVQTIAKVAAENPGDFFNQFLSSFNERNVHFRDLGKGMGHLKVGFSASFTILNLSRPVTIKEENLKTKAQWSPFLGETFPGSVEKIFYRGVMINHGDYA